MHPLEARSTWVGGGWPWLWWPSGTIDGPLMASPQHRTQINLGARDESGWAGAFKWFRRPTKSSILRLRIRSRKRSRTTTPRVHPILHVLWASAIGEWIKIVVFLSNRFCADPIPRLSRDFGKQFLSNFPIEIRFQFDKWKSFQFRLWRSHYLLFHWLGFQLQ